jgi:hypothetical protein
MEWRVEGHARKKLMERKKCFLLIGRKRIIHELDPQLTCIVKVQR